MAYFYFTLTFHIISKCRLAYHLPQISIILNLEKKRLSRAHFLIVIIVNAKMVSVSETHIYLFIIQFSCFDSSIRSHFLKYNDSSDTEFKLLGHLPPVFSQAYFIIIPLSFIHHIFPIFESSIFSLMHSLHVFLHPFWTSDFL